MHILVTGAGGYIGSEVALALRRRGHVVYGLARKEEDLKWLAKHEIIPIKGDQSDAKTLSEDLLNKVSAVVDTVMNYTDNPPLATNRALVNQLREASKRTGYKKRYIYTSGCLVYGDYPGQVVDESFLCKTAVPRVAFEKELAALQDIETVSVRPAWVYGGRGNKYTDWIWKANANGDIEIKGNPKKEWSWIHVYDLANAFATIAEAPAGAVAGQIFDVADDTRLTAEQIQVAFARAAGVKGKVVYSAANADPFSQLMENTIVLKADKIRRLGWQPKLGPVTDSLAIQWAAVQANSK